MDFVIKDVKRITIFIVFEGCVVECENSSPHSNIKKSQNKSKEKNTKDSQNKNNQNNQNKIQRGKKSLSDEDNEEHEQIMNAHHGAIQTLHEVLLLLTCF